MSKLYETLRTRAAQKRASSPAPVAPAPPTPVLPTGLSVPNSTRAVSNSVIPAWVNPGREVGESADLERIISLPVRPSFEEQTDFGSLSERLTAELRRPGGSMSLRDIQAFALDELRRVGGLVGLMAVGSGKTLLTLLAPTVLGVKRTVLLVPPQLKAQLLQRNFPDLAKHWRIPNVVGANPIYTDTDAVIYVVAYSQLSSAKTASVLEEIQPELLICDEAHLLKRSTAARTRRFRRFVKDARTSGTLRHVVLLSGTMVTKSIKDLDLLKWALGSGTPAPLDRNVLDEWAWALDPSDDPAPAGELMRLCRPGESARSGFRRRLVSTPGVVATAENALGCSLEIHERPLKTPPEVLKVVAELNDTWVTPWGEDVNDALVRWGYIEQLAAGLMYKRIWPRGEPEALRKEWLEARKAYFSEVRAYLQTYSRPGMDSPKLLDEAAKAGKWGSKHWRRWTDVKGACRPDTEPVWFHDFLVQDAIKWGREHRGLIWYEHAAVGARIAKEGGFTLVGRGVSGERALAALDGKRTVVISRPSRGTGTDGLQGLYSEQLVTTPLSNGAAWEQLLGRLHRPGQKGDVVSTYVYRHTPELIKALAGACLDAELINEIPGNEQKLCSATFTF